ncbi:hypothetical protein SDC9_82970 [bioreactor metagenome]|uniref:Uncharacterized protein n=1 Tax=bioreactor metagenome TaxID=1076179 RepID=A0A644ZER9_9ZZZZ
MVHENSDLACARAAALHGAASMAAFDNVAVAVDRAPIGELDIVRENGHCLLGLRPRHDRIVVDITEYAGLTICQPQGPLGPAHSFAGSLELDSRLDQLRELRHQQWLPSNCRPQEQFHECPPAESVR